MFLNIKFLHLQKYVLDGSPVLKQQLYQNITNQPLLTGEPTQLILTILAVPELHLLIGRYTQYINYISDNISVCIVDKLMTEFERRVLSSKTAGRKFMDDFLKKVQTQIFVKSEPAHVKASANFVRAKMNNLTNLLNI